MADLFYRIITGWLTYVVLPWTSAIIILYGIALASPRHARLPFFFGRVLAFIAGLGICASYGVFISIVFTILGRPGLSQWSVARAFKWLMYGLIGVWLEVEDPSGALNNRPSVILGNHQTELDILLLAHIFPRYTSVSAKSSLKYVPFLGWFMWASNTVFINRTNRQSALAAFTSAADTMKSKQQNVYIFPEGTRSYYHRADLLPFKKGAFHLAVQAQVPIVPVVCANYSHILDLRKGRWHFKSGKIPVRVLPAVETKGLTSAEVDGLVERVRNDMLEAIKELDVRVKTELLVEQKSEASNGLREKAKIAMAS